MTIVSVRRSSLVAGSVVAWFALLALGCDFRASQSFAPEGHDAGAAGSTGNPKLGTGGSSATGSGSTSGVGSTGGGGTGAAGQGGVGAIGCPAHCPSGQVCLGGSCQPDPCLAAASSCATGTTCHATCVAVVDPCAGNTCADGETCVAGACVAGCFLEPCNGVTCPSGQYCNPGERRLRYGRRLRRRLRPRDGLQPLLRRPNPAPASAAPPISSAAAASVSRTSAQA